MAGSYHQTIVLGTVGSDAEMRYLQSGSPVTNFSVAVNEYWIDQSTDERREKTTWYRCNAWGRQAEIAHEYVRKGMQIMVVGNVSASAYTDNEGNPRASLELKVLNMQFVGNRGESEQRNTEPDGDSIPF